LRVSDDHMPACSNFILEGLHHRLFVRICHVDNMLLYTGVATPLDSSGPRRHRETIPSEEGLPALAA
jgi:hypothetical protein